MLINNLRYADDIDLLDENINKTKIMVFGERNPDARIQVSEETIENVERFEYLGRVRTWDDNCL